MIRFVPAMLLLGFLFTAVPPGWASEPNAEQTKAIAEIQKLGGTVRFVGESPGKPAISVEFDDGVTDADLSHLKNLPNLQFLRVYSSSVTDAGLEHLKGLSQLQTLDLLSRNVTDAGLVHLKGLARLQSLYLLQGKVTDAGLVELQRLSQLQTLWIHFACHATIGCTGIDGLGSRDDAFAMV